MARTPHLALRVDDATKARWETAARDAGYSLADYVREAVNARVEADTAPVAPRKPKRAAKGAEPAEPARSTRVSMCEHRRPPETYCPKCDS